jgi:hypothetical protein
MEQRSCEASPDREGPLNPTAIPHAAAWAHWTPRQAPRPLALIHHQALGIESPDWCAKRRRGRTERELSFTKGEGHQRRGSGGDADLTGHR